MTAFVLAAFFLVITPGPGVLSTAGVGAAFGFRAGLPYLSGIVFGSLLVMAAVATGLAAFLFSYPPLRVVLLVVSAAYLLYLAFRIATAGSGVAITAAERPLRFVNGILLQIINPKAYAVMTALFTGFAFYPQNTLIEGLVKALAFTAIRHAFRRRPGTDPHIRRVDLGFTDLYPMGIEEPRAAPVDEHIDVHVLETLGLLMEIDLLHDPVHVLHHRPEIEPGCGVETRQPEARRRLHGLGQLGSGEDRLGRHAAEVRALAADLARLQHGHACSAASGRHRRCQTGGPAAHDDHVIANHR